MPYCPSCRTEYRQETAACADCGTALIAELGTEPTPLGGERIDVFVPADEQQADRAVDLLAQNDIEALVRDRSSSAFPMHVGGFDSRRVAVRLEDRDSALGFLSEAIAASALAGDIIDE